jgi:steroid delta-isomerase-like uncharacterized protein
MLGFLTPPHFANGRRTVSSVSEVCQRYFAAWNRHDPAGVAACFAADGTYTDPVSGTISGQAIADYVAGLIQAFPDLRFEVGTHGVVTHGVVDPQTLAGQWRMLGTNRGSMRGLPPTGRTIDVPGADFITVEDGAIRSVTGYFDAGAVPRQIGMMVVAQPKSIGPVSFGTCTHMQSPSTAMPGAFSLTSLQYRSDEELENIRQYSRKMFGEMSQYEGFVSMLTAAAGGRAFTVTAWTDVDAPRKFMTQGTHKTAMQAFFSENLSAGGFTSVWVPARLNPVWVRCPECGKMGDHAKNAGLCACGAALPPAPPSW